MKCAEKEDSSEQKGHSSTDAMIHKKLKKHSTQTETEQKEIAVVPSVSVALPPVEIGYNELEFQKPPIGSGVSADVYRGKWNGMDVAIKQVRKNATFLPLSVAHFKNEINFLPKLNHPNVVKMMGKVATPEDSGVGYSIVLEYLPRDLFDVIEKKDPLDHLQISYDMACALAYLHTNDILFRDLKPENVLVSQEGRAKISDFGLAVKTNSSGTYLSDSLFPAGTGTYIAPEIYDACINQRKPCTYTCKSDIFSLGVTMWVMQSHYSFFSQYRTPWERIQKIMEGEREAIPPGCDSDMAALIQSCWAHSPELRPTAKEVRDRLLCKLQQRQLLFKAAEECSPLEDKNHTTVERRMLA